MRPKADPRDRRRLNVKRYHYDTHAQLETHINDFIAAYNYARRLKTLKGLTPFEYIRKIWASEPKGPNLDPSHHKPGLKHFQLTLNHQYLAALRALRTLIIFDASM